MTNKTVITGMALLVLVALVMPVVSAEWVKVENVTSCGKFPNGCVHVSEPSYVNNDNFYEIIPAPYYENNSVHFLILSELRKQNDLLAEQNHILWVQTCYRPDYDTQRGYYGNYSAWEQECQKAGYPV